MIDCPACEKTDNETKVGTNILVKTFLSVSTKNNFKLYCDVCLTNLEKSIVESDSDKINYLEKKVSNMENK